MVFSPYCDTQTTDIDYGLKVPNFGGREDFGVNPVTTVDGGGPEPVCAILGGETNDIGGILRNVE